MLHTPSVYDRVLFTLMDIRKHLLDHLLCLRVRVRVRVRVYCSRVRVRVFLACLQW